MSIAVVGSINCDLVAYVERLPRPGETIAMSACAIGLGGKGANQAVAAQRLGSAVSLIGRVGDDSFGRAALADLQGYGLDTQLILADPATTTGVAMIHVAADGENTIAIIAGGNGALSGADLDRGRGALEAARVLLLQLETPLETSLIAAGMVRKAGGTVILDPAPAPTAGLPDAVLAAVDVVTPNETETFALTGLRPAEAAEGIAAARMLRQRGAPSAVVKMGGKGVAFSSAGDEGFVPPFVVQAIDTVAAGDSFNGGLAHAIAQGAGLAEAVRFAAACGALSTTRKGAAAAMPSLEAVAELIAASKPFR